MKAIIIGGGIGGPVAALALQRAGIEAHIYEAHASPADTLGLFLTLGSNGMRVLRELDVLEAVQQADIIPTPFLSIASATGKALGTVSNGWLDAHTPSITLMRDALQRTLMEAARKRGIHTVYHKRFSDYREAKGLVVARFEDVDEVGGDILIGADGIRSRVREVMSPDAPQPSYTGLLNLGGVVRNSGLRPTLNTMRMVWGRRAFFGYTVRPDGEAWWFANVGKRREPTRDELATVSVDTWKRQLRDLFVADPAFIGELIEATKVVAVSPIHDLPRLQRWSRERVVLMGDAAHAVSPSAGQGASMALEDALMLARCLRDLDPQSALVRYEALRRPRAERIVATGRRRSKYKAPESRTALFLRDLITPVAMRLFATDRAVSWIYDYEIPWDEPVLREAA